MTACQCRPLYCIEENTDNITSDTINMLALANILMYYSSSQLTAASSLNVTPWDCDCDLGQSELAT